MPRPDLKYDWFRRLNFDFDQVYPEAGGIAELDRRIVELSPERKEQDYAKGTTFRRGEVAVQRRLFALAKDDLSARAELAMLIAFTEGKNRVAALG